MVTARRPEAVQDLVDAHPDTAVAVALDVTDRAQIADAVARADAAFGGVDVLVNNAGYGYLSAVEEGDDTEVRALFDTNFFGAVDMIKAVLPGMRARGEGHIINVSSMTGIVTNPPNTYYSCTKHALEALTEGLAKEVAPLGIKVSAIEPGAFQTDYITRSMHQADNIEAYDEVSQRKELIVAFGEHLPGDPAKLAAAVLQLGGHGRSAAAAAPGPDVLGAFREKSAAWTRDRRRVGARHRRHELRLTARWPVAGGGPPVAQGSNGVPTSCSLSVHSAAAWLVVEEVGEEPVHAGVGAEDAHTAVGQVGAVVVGQLGRRRGPHLRGGAGLDRLELDARPRGCSPAAAERVLENSTMSFISSSFRWRPRSVTMPPGWTENERSPCGPARRASSRANSALAVFDCP